METAQEASNFEKKGTFCPCESLVSGDERVPSDVRRRCEDLHAIALGILSLRGQFVLNCSLFFLETLRDSVIRQRVREWAERELWESEAVCCGN